MVADRSAGTSIVLDGDPSLTTVSEHTQEACVCDNPRLLPSKRAGSSPARRIASNSRTVVFLAVAEQQAGYRHLRALESKLSRIRFGWPGDANLTSLGVGG